MIVGTSVSVPTRPNDMTLTQPAVPLCAAPNGSASPLPTTATILLAPTLFPWWDCVFQQQIDNILYHMIVLPRFSLMDCTKLIGSPHSYTCHNTSCEDPCARQAMLNNQ